MRRGGLNRNPCISLQPSALTCCSCQGALLDQLSQAAIELIELLDHQRHRAFGAALVAIRLLVSCADQPGQRLEIGLARRPGRFRKLPCEELVQGCYAASVIAVTVIVWLCSSQTPEALCGAISP